MTAEWSGASALRATIGHGLPFVYFTKTGDAKAVIRIPEAQASSLEIWHEGGEALGFSVRGHHHYAVFGPNKSHWQAKGGVIDRAISPAKTIFSVAVLPSKGDDVLERFRKHAYAFVTDSQSDLTRTTKRARSSPAISSSAPAWWTTKKGSPSDPIVALYPHQWKASELKTWPESYVSPRGTLKIAEAKKV